MPELESAARDPEFRKFGLKVGRVDLDYYKSLALRFHISGFPSLFLYQNGKNSSYTGGRKKKQIIEYFYKRFVDTTHKINSENDLEAFKDRTKLNKVVYFGTDRDKIRVYKEFAKDDDNLMFGLCDDPNVIKDIKILENRKDVAVIYKSFDEPNYEITSNITKESLAQLIDLNRLPLIKENFQSAVVESLQLRQSTVIFITNTEDQNLKKMLNSDFKKMAQKFRTKIYFTSDDISNEVSKRVLNVSDVVLSDLTERNNTNPIIIIFDYYKGFNKWIFNNLFDAYSFDNFASFIQNFLDKKYKPNPRSEEIPAEQTSVVYKLVQKSFNSEVMESNTTFLVKFFIPTCKHCQRLAPIYEELALKYKGNKGIKIAEFDLSKNDFDLFDINSYPKVVLFKANDKRNHIIFSGNRTVEEFSQFIEKNIK